jgi:hypothetical protein
VAHEVAHHHAEFDRSRRSQRQAWRAYRRRRVDPRGSRFALRRQTAAILGAPDHGQRTAATFRTWAKSKRLDREIAELVLGHVFYSSSESPYARDDDAVLSLRRDMLELWGRHCAGRNGELIAFPTRA